jgi:carbamoyl-phosphate synthase large subunit
VLPTLGGQTALNLAMELYERGLHRRAGHRDDRRQRRGDRHRRGSRAQFKQAMIEIGLSVPASGTAHDDGRGPQVVPRSACRSSSAPPTSSAAGTGIASTPRSSSRLAANGLAASPISEILIEKSIAGWKEYELEVMRDRADNCVIICSIENVDPMGVHTGDSITVAPAQTSVRRRVPEMRDAAFACIRRVGVETGGSNVQFAVNPANGDQVVIEMNPRVSRSSALASKATGFPDRQDRGQARRRVHARRDPQRHHQEDPGQLRAEHRLRRHQDPALGVREAARHQRCARHADAVGGRGDVHRPHVPESLQKGLRSLEQGRLGLGCDPPRTQLAASSDADLLAACGVPTPERIFQVGELLRRGVGDGRRVHEHEDRPVVPRPDVA